MQQSLNQFILVGVVKKRALESLRNTCFSFIVFTQYAVLEKYLNSRNFHKIGTLKKLVSVKKTFICHLITPCFRFLLAC